MDGFLIDKVSKRPEIVRRVNLSRPFIMAKEQAGGPVAVLERISVNCHIYSQVQTCAFFGWPGHPVPHTEIPEG